VRLPKSGIHIVGIGGAGMSAIARVLVGNGYQITGSDAKDSKRLLALQQLGVKVFVGHFPENVSNAQVVISSTAIPDENIELVTARAKGLMVLNRAQALSVMLADQKVIAIAGTHGKTTTTSMTTIELQHLGLDPSFIIGSELNETGSNGHFGESDLFIVEADESDRTFLSLNPEIGIITNIEADHLDRWESLNEIKSGFFEFARACKTGLVVCADDAAAIEIASAKELSNVSVISYGFGANAKLRITNQKINTNFWQADLLLDGETIGQLVLQVPGNHNLLNATAAIAAGILLGHPPEKLIEGLKKFTGTRRRFEYRGIGNRVKVFDDYAHHPTEVRATLTAAKTVAQEGSVIVVFQPFRYYRVNAFLTEFADALQLADKVIVLETYAPGEQAIPGSGGAAVAAAITARNTQVVFEPSFLKVVDLVCEWATPGDIVLTLGAGDMAMLAPEIVTGLQRKNNE